MDMNEITGERLNDNWLGTTVIEHLHRYALTSYFINNKIVVDLASGEGYGSNLMADHAKEVTGIDISSNVIEYANKKYKKKNLVFKVGSATDIPIPDRSIDIVVSFETIEHHAEHDKMMNEIKRILKNDGILIISTPDKRNYSDIPKYQNPFHVKELYLNEFKELMQKHFTFTDFYHQKVVFSSLITNPNSESKFYEFEGNYNNISTRFQFDPLYNICIASNQNHNMIIPTTLFDGEAMKNKLLIEATAKVQRSKSFILGNFLLKPFSIIKNLLKI